MKIKLLLPVLALLVACPTPPENKSNGGPSFNQTAQGQAPSNQPPGEASARPSGSQPTAEAGSPPPGGEQPTPEADAPPAGAEAPSKSAQPPPQQPGEDKAPQGGIITDSLLIKVNRIPNKPAVPSSVQADIKDDSVAFSGKITCDDCKGPLILRVVQFIGPNGAPSPNDLITQKEVTVGDFSILIPKSDTAVALELLVDSDKSGAPSVGERFAVIEMGGQMIPSDDRSKLNLDATNREVFTPAPIPNGAPEQ